MLFSKLFRRLLLIVFVVGFTGCLFWQVWLDVIYSTQMPKSPQPESGRIYEISVNHGTIVHIRREELARATFVFEKLLWIEFACLAGIGVLRVYYREP